MVQNGIRTSQITGDLTFPRRLNSAEPGWCGEASKHQLRISNDLTIGWQNLNPLSHPNTTLAPQAMEARASGENLNYVTLALQARWWWHGELLAESLVWYPELKSLRISESDQAYFITAEREFISKFWKYFEGICLVV